MTKLDSRVARLEANSGGDDGHDKRALKISIDFAEFVSKIDGAIDQEYGKAILECFAPRSEVDESGNLEEADPECPADWAKERLSRLKPFETWLAEKPRSDDDRELYQQVVQELQTSAAIDEEENANPKRKIDPKLLAEMEADLKSLAESIYGNDDDDGADIESTSDRVLH